MTLPESQSAPDEEPTPTGAAPLEGLAPELETIDVDTLDKENQGWVKRYLEQLQVRLAEEQGADAPDLVMVGYLKREIATYQELLARTDGK